MVNPSADFRNCTTTGVLLSALGAFPLLIGFVTLLRFFRPAAHEPIFVVGGILMGFGGLEAVSKT